jgi:hypothetical protein
VHLFRSPNHGGDRADLERDVFVVRNNLAAGGVYSMTSESDVSRIRMRSGGPFHLVVGVDLSRTGCNRNRQ